MGEASGIHQNLELSSTLSPFMHLLIKDYFCGDMEMACILFCALLLLGGTLRTMTKVGIVLLNYNLPQETDALVERIHTVVKVPFELVVIDNASDRAAAAKATNVRTIVNMRTGGANIVGAHALADRFPEVDSFFFMHNDMWFDSDVCPLGPLLAIFEEDPKVAAVHPAIRADVQLGDWFLQRQFGSGWKYAPKNSHGKVIMDDICPVLIKKSAYFDVGGFDPRLSRCYGAGLNLYDRLVQRGFEIAICYEVEVYHRGQYSYSSGVAEEAYLTCDQEAIKEWDFVFTEKYGPAWRTLFDREQKVAQVNPLKKLLGKLSKAFS